ncbi:MAG: HIT family protein [Dermatophilaceae bacterium]|nr:HIT family protein [Dermatophilaceae bacterium]
MADTTTCSFCVSIECEEYFDRDEHTALFVPRTSSAVPGHLLVVPLMHVERFDTDPHWTGVTMQHAARWARDLGSYNVIVNVGEDAGMTAHHLHVHLLPRVAGDQVPMPWPDRRRAAGLDPK